MRLQHPPACHENMNEPGLSNGAAGEVDSARNLTQKLPVIVRRINRDDDAVRLDPKFLRERRTGITGHREILYRNLSQLHAGYSDASGEKIVRPKLLAPAFGA